MAKDLQKVLEEYWVLYCFEKARENVSSLVEKERQYEKPSAELMSMRLD